MSVELYQQFLQQFNYVSEQVKSNTVYKNIKTLLFINSLLSMEIERALFVCYTTVVCTCPNTSSLTEKVRSMSTSEMSFSLIHSRLWWNSASSVSTSVNDHGLHKQSLSISGFYSPQANSKFT